MRFRSSAERLGHPQAGLIPDILWSYLFHFELSDLELFFLSRPLADIISRRLEVVGLSDEQQLNAWLCILLRNPESESDALIDRAAQLNFSNDILFIGAALTNRMDILRKIDAESIEIKERIKSNHYLFFQLVVTFGFFDVFQKLFSIITKNQLHEMIKSNFYGIFRYAAEKGHVNILEWLKDNCLEQLQAMIAAKTYYAFGNAAQNGHAEVLDWLKANSSPEQLQAMIAAENYHAFRYAAAYGHTEVLDWLKANASPEPLQAMIAAENYHAFRYAAANGHSDMLDWLKANSSPEQLQAMIAAEKYHAFRYAAVYGHPKVFDWINAHSSPEQLETMIAAENYYAFQYAAAYGHTEVLDWLKANSSPEQLQAMIAAEKYHAFRFAAANGYSEVLDWLNVNSSPEQLQAMIAAENYHAFQYAAANGHSEVLDWLKANSSPEQLQAMIAAEKYHAFRFAAANGYSEVLDWLNVNSSPEQLQAMIAAEKYHAFRFAAQNTRIVVLDWLKARASFQFQAMITADNYGAFYYAVEETNLKILHWLTLEAPLRFQDMISDNNYAALRNAKKKGQEEVVKYLLSCLPSFENTEQQNRWVGLIKKHGLFRSLTPLTKPRHDIPKNIHLIWLGSPMRHSHVSRTIEWKKLNAECDVTIWTDPEFQLITENVFSNSSITVNTITSIDMSYNLLKWAEALVKPGDNSPNYAAASDIYRMCILDNYGGWYVDTDIQPFDIGTVFINEFLQFHFFGARDNKLVSELYPSVIAAKPRSLLTRKGLEFLEELSHECITEKYNQMIRSDIASIRMISTHLSTGLALRAALGKIYINGLPIIEMPICSIPDVDLFDSLTSMHHGFFEQSWILTEAQTSDLPVGLPGIIIDEAYNQILKGEAVDYSFVDDMTALRAIAYRRIPIIHAVEKDEMLLPQLGINKKP